YEVYEKMGDKSKDEFLQEILKAEIESRNNSTIVKKIKRAGFPTLKRFEELKTEYLPEDAQRRIEELKSLEFIENHRNVIMLGNSGTGKTHLATAMGIQACEKGYNVSFKTAAKLVNELKEAKDERQLTKYARIFEKYDMVILDELGYISFDTEGSELLFQYIAMRYERKSTVITTNLIFSDWIKTFHDTALTMALLDRITHNAIILNMNGESYRRRQGTKK
ncbi:MAG: IS21-like element helper ATPase IstB, partial [Thermotogae bacterium]|nr:IS21-like element helper ATPase IstB [Thermotogota bacterium]